MAINVEWKARARNFQRQLSLVEAIAGIECEILSQVDTFFPTPRGRLKLRQFSPDYGELIHYRRDDEPTARCSVYHIAPTCQPELLAARLTDALGAIGIVRKTRRVYHLAQTRIHFDQVQELGEFIETEVVLQPNQSVIEGQSIANDVMRKLEVQADDILANAYIDQLLARDDHD